MSVTALNEYGQSLGTLRDALAAERNSRKLYGYDFVNYRSDCETSNVNGLLKYNDVVNFGRRISDASVHNCVMCGEFDVVIPTQNKDVCKGCDSSFWYNAKLNVTFKFCKGCKNFVTLEMFSDKPDASKCCRCRRRGRENYLTKKFIGTQDMCVTPGQTADSPAVVSPAVSADSPEETPGSSKKDLESASTPAVGTPSSGLRSAHTVPSNGSDGSCPSSASSASSARSVTEPRRYKRRATSVDTPGAAAMMPAKPPKTPRSVSYSSEMPRRTVTPSWGFVQPLPLSVVNTPSGKKAATVTPGSFSFASASSAGSSGSTGRTVRFARSNSVCSADGAYVGKEEPARKPDQDQGQQYLWNRSVSGPDSPEADATNTTPLHCYMPNYSSHTPRFTYNTATSTKTSLDARSSSAKTDASALFPYPSSEATSTSSDKENAQQSKSIALDAISILHNSCARLFSDAAEDVTAGAGAGAGVVVVSPAVSEAPGFRLDSSSQGRNPHCSAQEAEDAEEAEEAEERRFWGSEYHCEYHCGYQPPAPAPAPAHVAIPGSHCKDLRRLHSTDSAVARSPQHGPVATSVSVSSSVSGPVMVTQSKEVVDHRYVPSMTAVAPFSSSSSSSASSIATTSASCFSSVPAPFTSTATGRARLGSESSQDRASQESESQRSQGSQGSQGSQALQEIGSPARRQWEWDPSRNPLMHLAMITERI